MHRAELSGHLLINGIVITGSSLICMDKGRTTYLLLFSSILAYALNGVFEFVLIGKVSVTTFFFLWSIGGVAVAPLLIPGLKADSSLRKGYKGIVPSIMGSLFIVGFNIFLFLAFKQFLLAEVYPLIALSSLVFFFLDIAMFRGQIKLRVIGFVLSGILVVIAGVYFIGGSTSFSFKADLLPYVFAIPVFTGFGYYLLSYNLTDFSAHLKSAFIIVASLIISSILFIIRGPSLPGPVTSLFIAATGALYVSAVYLELLALRINEKARKARNVVIKNYINNFTYLDTVLVLLGSIVIGSYMPIEIFGGLLIVIGVVIVSMAKKY